MKMETLIEWFTGERLDLTHYFEFEETADTLSVTEIGGPSCPGEFSTFDVPISQLDSDFLSLDYVEKTNKPPHLRILWIEAGTQPVVGARQRYQIPSALFKTIVESSGLESSFRGTLSTRNGIQAIPSRTHPSRVVYFVFSSPNYRHIWIHDDKLNLTRALIIGDNEHIVAAKSLLPELGPAGTHLMFMALLVTIIFCRSVERHARNTDEAILRSELMTGHNSWSLEPLTSEVPFATLSARAAGTAAELALSQKYLLFLKAMLAFIETNTAEAEKSSKEPLPDIQRTLGIIQSRTTVLESEILCGAKRTDVQMTSIFQLIAQQDSKMNVHMARDSRGLALAAKRDSSSMKTLAAVTVIYLPGSFVAALFAMPFFHFDNVRGRTILSENFWMYWAITLPLSVVTILAWLLFTRWHTRAIKIESDEADASLVGGEKEKDDGVGDSEKV